MTRARKVEGAAQRYGHDHRKLRDHHAQAVARGNGMCTEHLCTYPTRWIPPGAPWDLAHAPDGTYLGPAHRRCNRAAAARIGNHTRHTTQAIWHTRRW